MKRFVLNNVSEDIYSKTKVADKTLYKEKDGKLYTPPVSCGLLNGTYRQKLLEEGKLIEKVLYPEDLQTADKIFCFNSVRKMVEVQLCL